MQRFNLSAWAITHRALVLFMMIVLAGAGIYSYFNLGRAEDPSFTIKVMIVNVSWPGATAAEMQKQVADKIEKKLQELPYLDRVESYSRPGVSFIRIILSDTTPPAQVKELWYQVRKKVGDIRSDLPPDISRPEFQRRVRRRLFGALHADRRRPELAELKARAEDIRQRLLRVPDVNKVDIIGEQPQRIYIEFSHAKLATLGITPQQIFDSVARQNAVASGGSVDTSADRINLRVTGAFSGVEAIAAVPVQADGRMFRLGDIATVKRGYEDPPSFIVRERRQAGARHRRLDAGWRQHHRRSAKTSSSAMKCDRRRAAGRRRDHADRRPAARWSTQSVSEFFHVFAEALAIVLIVSFLSLGLRTGIVVALSVPLVLAIVFVVMYATGFDLHRITLGRADHRARTAGRRRHHRHRNDGGEDGAGVRPR